VCNTKTKAKQNFKCSKYSSWNNHKGRKGKRLCVQKFFCGTASVIVIVFVNILSKEANTRKVNVWALLLTPTSMTNQLNWIWKPLTGPTCTTFVNCLCNYLLISIFTTPIQAPWGQGQPYSLLSLESSKILGGEDLRELVSLCRHANVHTSSSRPHPAHPAV
jgi:hypothetical protein